MYMVLRSTDYDFTRFEPHGNREQKFMNVLQIGCVDDASSHMKNEVPVVYVIGMSHNSPIIRWTFAKVKTRHAISKLNRTVERTPAGGYIAHGVNRGGNHPCIPTT